MVELSNACLSAWWIPPARSSGPFSVTFRQPKQSKIVTPASQRHAIFLREQGTW